MGDSDDDGGTSAKDYQRWKRLIPFLYDWLNHHHLTPWPSITCRWGPQIKQGKYKNVQRLYLSERTDGTAPNTLLVMNADVVRPRVASAESICRFNEAVGSPMVKRHKLIPHPGEVNKIRELTKLPHIVVTHTDAPQLYVWNVNRQPNKNISDDPTPDMVLVGHEDNAPFALGMSHLSAMVTSGGEDNLVLLWSLEDHKTNLVADEMPHGKAPQLEPRMKFEGHKATVEDVKFNPQSDFELCSVGDDKSLLFWDSREGSSPVLKVLKAHNKDVHCVDWSPFDENIIVTGSADSTMKLWDRRKLKLSPGNTPLHVLDSHSEELKTVEWSPHHKGILASSSADKRVNVWDCNRFGARQSVDERKYGPPELIFQHAGHRYAVEDAHWNPAEEWTMMSVSDDSSGSDENGGGTLQLWRINDLIYRPEKDVLQELDAHRQAITAHKLEKTSKPAQNPKKVVKTSKESGVKDEAPKAIMSEGVKNDSGMKEEALKSSVVNSDELKTDIGEGLKNDSGEKDEASKSSEAHADQTKADASEGVFFLQTCDAKPYLCTVVHHDILSSHSISSLPMS
mmetsp:Transcript_10242/g.19377  ORF Transcript_10242/g.19377 Transcript_10242/m.19377 type:complete len:567 (+) Transcript_10242:151-1851(+)